MLLATTAVTNGSYHLVWDAAADLAAAAAPIQSTSVRSYVTWSRDPIVHGIQLWADGPGWAECNLGAENPWEYGDYFFWGDTVGCKWDGSKFVRNGDSSGASFSFSSGNALITTYNKDEATLRSEGVIDASGNLTAAYDAATAQLGAAWRMPTQAEIQGLVDNCSWSSTSLNGVYGYRVMGRGDFADKSIFLPLAGYGTGTSLYDRSYEGYCWSASVSSGSGLAWSLYFYDGHDDWGVSSYYRYFGFSVRPVSGFTSK